MYSITENIYYSRLSYVALLLQPEPVSHGIIQGKDCVLSPYVLSSCGLLLPPTCLLVTVNEARNYFEPTIQWVRQSSCEVLIKLYSGFFERRAQTTWKPLKLLTHVSTVAIFHCFKVRDGPLGIPVYLENVILDRDEDHRPSPLTNTLLLLPRLCHYSVGGAWWYLCFYESF
jgi:hypothetical protein